jgi:hypothetical protein
MPGRRCAGSGLGRRLIRRSVPRSPPIDPALDDPLEELWKDRPPENAPISQPRQTGAIPSSASAARSLQMQAQIEAEARRIAWQQTYGKSPGALRVATPTIPADRATSAGKDQTAAISSTTVSTKAPPPEPHKPLPVEPPARWRTFTPIALNSVEIIQGVYSIVQITTGRLYVGSSIHVVRRLRDHAATLRAQRHHTAKLQEAWRAAGGDGFRFFIVERVSGSIDALRAREQYWITELRGFPQGFNSKRTADGLNLLCIRRSMASPKSAWPEFTRDWHRKSRAINQTLMNGLLIEKG